MRSIIFFWTALVLCAAASARGEPEWSYFPAGDDGYRAITNTAALEQCATEARIGDGAQVPMWERAIWARIGQDPPVTTGQFSWISGEPVKFTVEYDGEHTVRFTLDGVGLIWQEIAAPFSDLFIRTAATNGSSAHLAGQGFVTGTTFLRPESFGSGGAGDVDFIRISNGGEAFGAFVYYGDVIFNWSGEPPRGSALSFQTRMTNVLVPEPAALLLIAGMVVARRRPWSRRA